MFSAANSDSQQPAKKPKLETTPRVRVCDKCRSLRKACSGTQPCVTCARRGIPCEWSRGPPPTPPSAMSPPPAPDGMDESSLHRSASEQSTNALNNFGLNRSFTASNAPPQQRSTVISSSNHAVNKHEDSRMSPWRSPDHVPQANGSELPSRLDNRNFRENIINANHRDGSHKRRSSLDMVLLEEFNQKDDNHSVSSSRNSPDRDRIDEQTQPKSLDFGFLRRAMNNFRPPASYQKSPSVNILMAGDKPLSLRHEHDPELPSMSKAMDFVKSFFSVAMVSWRFLHQGQVESWVKAAYNDRDHSQINDKSWHAIGYGRQAILLAILALASYHETNSSTWSSDELFHLSCTQLRHETGAPTLESVQARLTQSFYLLATSRTSQAWYSFGNASQLATMLDLDKKSGRGNFPQADYIEVECRKRTFWTLYILEKCFAIMMGSSRGFINELINQDLPEAVNDEYMTPEGSAVQRKYNSTMSALIGHAKLTQILSRIYKSIYPATHSPEHISLPAVHILNQALSDWKSDLPAIFGNDEIRASDLAPVLGRQSRGLTLAYAHAVMLTNRPSLTTSSLTVAHNEIRQCISAARLVIETVISIRDEEPHFQTPWWTNYVTFCALVVTNVYAIQRLAMEGQSQSQVESEELGRDLKLYSLVEKLQDQFLGDGGGGAGAGGLVEMRYRCVLEELRAEYMRQKARKIGVLGEVAMGNMETAAVVEGIEVGDKVEAWGAIQWADMDAWAHKNKWVG